MEKRQYLIALTFEDQNFFLSKIKNFKLRHTQGASFSQTVNLPLFAPFSVETHKDLEALELLEEEVNSFFLDPKDLEFVKFSNIDFYKHKKKFLLYLTPSLSIDMKYCLESLKDLAMKNLKIVKEKQSKEPYLTLGKFHDELELMHSLQRALKEFILPLEVRVHTISLFEKYEDYWREIKPIYTFDLGKEAIGLQELYAY